MRWLAEYKFVIRFQHRARLAYKLIINGNLWKTYFEPLGLSTKIYGSLLDSVTVAKRKYGGGIDCWLDLEGKITLMNEEQIDVIFVALFES